MYRAAAVSLCLGSLCFLQFWVGKFMKHFTTADLLRHTQAVDNRTAVGALHFGQTCCKMTGSIHLHRSICGTFIHKKTR